MISREKTDAALTSMARDELTHADVLAAIPHAVESELTDLLHAANGDTQALQERYAALQQEIDNLVQSLAQIGASNALTARLQVLETEVTVITQRIEASRQSRPTFQPPT